MITSRALFIHKLRAFIRDEEKGQEEYRAFIAALPDSESFDSVRQALRNIASQERNHTVVLKHILANVE